MMSAIAGTLDAVANGNASAIERWSADKAQAVSATAAVVEKGDPRGLTRLMGQTNDFPITSVGWSDKTFFSTANTPADYDPTSRPWYKSAVESGKLTVTKPYGDSGTGKPYVAFTTPIVREGKTIGALSGAVALDGVKAIIQAIHPTPSSLAFVLGSDGQVISHVDDKFALKPATEVAPEARGAQGPGARRRRAGGDHAGRRREAGQGQAHSRHRLVSGGGAGQTEATVGLTQVFNATLIALVVLTLAALAIASLITSRAFKRLSAVRDAMDTIGSGDGDMTHRLDVVGHDEVAQISVLQRLRRQDQHRDAGRARRRGLHEHRDQRDRHGQPRPVAAHRDLGRLAGGNLGGPDPADLQREADRRDRRAGHAPGHRGQRRRRARRPGGVRRGPHHGRDLAVVRAHHRDHQRDRRHRFPDQHPGAERGRGSRARGEQGRGFAVVAGEVRTLAQRSAASAQEIKALIEASVQNVKSGTERVQAAGVTMTEIVQGIDRVQRLVTEIHGAMTEQSVGISQIDRSVSDMDQATQQNAALVEQSAAAAALLNDQARALAGTVARFKLRGDLRQAGPALALSHA